MLSRENAEIEAGLLADVRDWAAQKLVAKEPFAVLLVSHHPTGKKLTVFHASTIPEALAQCRGDLVGQLSDALAYALAYEAKTKTSNGLKPVLVFQTELRGAGAHEQFAQRFELKKKWFSTATEFVSREDIRALNNGEPWLVRANQL